MKLLKLVMVIVLAGCGSGPGPHPTPSVSTRSFGPQPAHFIATVDHATGTLSFSRVSPPSGLTPQSVDSINDPSSADGNPTSADVDLVSTSPCTFPPGQFQCDIQMIWGSPNRTLRNPVVQIDSITLNGAPTSLYDANNSDEANPLSIPVDHGLWAYTNSGEPDEANPVGGGGPYYLTAEGTGFNTGTRLWSFDNPQNADVAYDILVWASINYSTYTFGFGSAAYVDVCSGGASYTSLFGKINLPFDVATYTQTYVTGSDFTFNFALNGQMTFGPVGLAAATEPPDGGLPSNVSSAPAFWAFWDDIGYGPGGRMCYQLLGDAPNRSLAVEWRGMTFRDAPDEGANLDFEAFVREGTSTITTYYNSMQAAPGDTSGREKGTEAWVGIQNPGATAAVGQYHVADYGTGASYTYVGQP